MPGAQAGFSARAYQEQSYLKPLAWARRNLNLDDDRVYLTGYSQGGHVSWHMAALFGHHFAAAAPVAGAPIFEGYPATTTAYLGNLANLPTWALWGELDGAPAPAVGNVDLCRQADRRLRQLKIATYRGTELKGRGHHGCWPAGAKLLAFFAAHRRQAAPPALTHVFHLPAHRRAYYLEAVRLARKPIDFSKGVRVSVPAGARPDKDTLAKLLQQHAAKSLFRIQATREPKTNALRLRTVGVRTLRVYVLDGLLDLRRPVVIHHAGRTWRGKVAESAKCVLTHYLATRDASAPVLNEIDLEGGKVTVRFAQGAD
jgi:pimeloyl-ACP methyl ester carboxylesterase